MNHSLEIKATLAEVRADSAKRAEDNAREAEKRATIFGSRMQKLKDSTEYDLSVCQIQRDEREWLNTSSFNSPQIDRITTELIECKKKGTYNEVVTSYRLTTYANKKKTKDIPEAISFLNRAISLNNENKIATDMREELLGKNLIYKHKTPWKYFAPYDNGMIQYSQKDPSVAFVFNGWNTIFSYGLHDERTNYENLVFEDYEMNYLSLEVPGHYVYGKPLESSYRVYIADLYSNEKVDSILFRTNPSSILAATEKGVFVKYQPEGKKLLLC